MLTRYIYAHFLEKRSLKEIEECLNKAKSIDIKEGMTSADVNKHYRGYSGGGMSGNSNIERYVLEDCSSGRYFVGLDVHYEIVNRNTEELATYSSDGKTVYLVDTDKDKILSIDGPFITNFGGFSPPVD